MGVIKWAGYILSGIAVLGAAVWAMSMPNSEERGVWRHEANGTILRLGRLRAELFHQTAATCTPGLSFPAQMALVKAMEGAWIEVEGDVLELHVDGNLAPARFDRIPALPEACEAPGQDDPASTFAAMWAMMDEHYAFFDLHGVTWADRRALAPPATASEEELFDAMKAALAGLDDGHLQLIAHGLGYHSPAQGPDWMPDPPLARESLNQRARNAIGVPLEAVPRTGLEYGLREDGIGYVLITQMSTEPRFGQLGSDLAAESFAGVAAALAPARAIIIDVRYNPGGDDGTAFAYAAHLTDAPVPVLTKRTRQGDGWTEPFEATLQPSAPYLPQPVVLLTSQLTGSAAEIFTMALRELPQVTVMGENTAGGLSDILGATLPNGWLIGLSNQDYRTPDGLSYEGVGLPPDIRIDTGVAALQAGADPVLEAAIGFLNAP